MLWSLVILLILLIMVMVACVVVSGKRDEQNCRQVVHLIWTAIIAAACYTAFLLVPPDYYGLAVFMDGLYFLSTDWLVVNLLLFTTAYTGLEPPTKLPRYIIVLLALADSISFVVNTFTRHMFELEAEMMGMAGDCYWNVHFKQPHYIHRLFVYSIVLYSLLILLYRFIK